MTLTNPSNWIYLIAMIIPLIFAITLHEVAHGWVASKLGDKTALLMGRITLNPLKHIDLFGTLLLPTLMLLLTHFTFAFGWAKPVPVNWKNLKNPRRDMAWVALAGPFTNLLMAFLWAAVAKLTLLGMSPLTHSQNLFSNLCYQAGHFGLMINLILMVLNLIPIPPLDGSRIVSSLLSPKLAYSYEKIEPYGIWILLALLILGVLNRLLLYPVSYLALMISTLFGLPFSLI